MSTETNTNNSIAGHAMLVSLSFSLCRQSRQLVSEARSVEERKHAAAGTTRVSCFYFQQLVGNKNNDALFDLKSFFGHWRAEHTRLTRAWPGDMRLLPAPLLEQYLTMKSTMEEQAPAKVQEFMDVYNDWRVTAPDRMGQLFEESDFPTRTEVSESIGWKTMLLPLPDGQAWKHIRLISPNLAETMEQSTNEQIAKAVEDARLATWNDLIAPVQKIVESLTKDKVRIFDSLITNLNDILLLGGSFNLTNDPDMTRFIEEAKASLATINPDDLRADPEIRKTAVRNAQEILSRFGSYGRKFVA